MKATLAAGLFLLLSASVSMGQVLLYDGFTDEPSTNPPTGWTPGGINEWPTGYMASNSLTYAGTASSGNSFGNGDGQTDYSITLPEPLTLAGGETVYMSFLMKVTEPDVFYDGRLRLYDSSKYYDSGVCVGFGTSDYTTDQMGFSINNRLRAWNHVDSVTTPETYAISNVTYLVVASYTRGESGNGSGSVNLWVNPAISPTPGTPTVTQASYREDEDYDTFVIWTTGGSSFPEDWLFDEFKIGTNWTAVVSDSVPTNPPPVLPVAGFSASPTSGYEPLVVSFTDTSTGTITNRYWDFGDGATTNITGTSIDHTYATDGTYTVALTASGPAGSDTDTQADLITVIDVPPGTTFIESDPADQSIGVDTNDTPAMIWSADPILFMGDDYYEYGKGDMCGILVFELPDLGGQAIASANLAVDYVAEHIGGGDDPMPKGVDLYGVRYNAANIVLPIDYGFKSIGTNNGTLLQDAFIYEEVSQANDWAVEETDAAGDAALASWLADQYTAGAVAGDYVFLRLHSDSHMMNPIKVASGNSTAQSKPTLTITVDTGPASFVSTEIASPGVLKLVFSATGSLADLSLVGREDLTSGSWGYTPHSDDGVHDFVVTNLSYSTEEGGNRAVYVETTNSAAFYGIE